MNNTNSNLIESIDVSIDDHGLDINVIYASNFVVDLNDVEIEANRLLEADGIFPTQSQVNMCLILSSDKLVA